MFLLNLVLHIWLIKNSNFLFLKHSKILDNNNEYVH
jgi:hypothetical protein